MTTKIVIEEVVSGLNGNGGLIREHFRNAMKKKDRYTTLVRSQTRNKHKGKVIITYTRYSITLMDWDNLGASFKHLGDSLVAANIIQDDKPSIVVEFIPKQEKVSKRIEQRVEIVIEDVE
jgi:hypothetical protein